MVNRWTRFETNAIVRAVRNAPVLCPEQPWVLELPRRSVELYEQASGERGDSAGLDRLLSCGTALANAVVTVRALGWDTTIHVKGNDPELDLVARVTTSDRKPPSSQETLLYGQIRGADVVNRGRGEPADLRRLADTSYFPGVRLELISDRPRAAALGCLLLDVSRRLDGDHRSARELAPWFAARVHSTVLAGGRAASTTTEPYIDAVCAIAAQLITQPMFAVVTDGDERADHVLAGAATQIGCLAGTHLGFATHPVVRLMHLPDVRRRLMDELGLTGFPQALLGVTPTAMM